ncbi:MAG: HD-GYP domain-containing protein [Phycisphaeraceae bacterium]|nr:MAG: HD-GYP domain-containing protein [Phycisphaeraceae bacterium]
MSVRTVQDGLTCARTVLRERCCALGLPTLRCDVEGRIIREAEQSGIAGGAIARDWIQSGFITARLRKLASNWIDSDHPEPEAIIPGCWAIPVIETRRRRRVGYIVAFALSAAALDEEHFVSVCQGASLDLDAAREALRHIAVYDAEAALRTARMLTWTLGDRLELAVNEETLSGFSRQLTEAYEELNLLYKLGQSMNELAQPAKFVHLLCEELHATLSFKWIAARFADEDRDARHVAGQTVIVGEKCCPENEFLDTVDELMARIDGPQAMVVNLDKLHNASKAGDSASTVLVHPMMRDGRLIGALIAGEKQGVDDEISSVDIKLLDGAGQYLNILLQNAALYDDQQSMFLGTLEALSASIDAKDRYTCGHSERVAHLAMMLARDMGFDETEVERIRIAGLVHDVGKIGVPETVLCKPGRLTDEEFVLIKAHPEIGHRILKDIPQLADVLPAVLHHHERWDGQGYPHRLAAKNTPLYARIIGLADSFDAMSSTRTYRSAMPRAQVLAEIERCAGTQFDPELAPRFVKLDFSAYDALVARHVDRERQASSHGRAA